MNSEAVISEAKAADAPTVVAHIREMLKEMVAVGGHPVSTDEQGWARFTAEIAGTIGRGESLCLLAAQSGQSSVVKGVIHASIVTRESVFEPARVLHVHALFVHPAHRGRGIGKALLEAALEWGRYEGCAEAELNVLGRNPARGLYERLGFHAFQTEMVREL